MRLALTAALLILAASSSVGCVSRATRSDGLGLNAGGVRDRASFDFNCAKENVQVVDLDGRSLSFGATGCGKRAAYIWHGSTVVLNSPITATEDVAGQK